MPAGVKTGRRRALSSNDSSTPSPTSVRIPGAHLPSSVESSAAPSPDDIVIAPSLSTQPQTNGVASASRSTRVRGPTVGKGLQKEINRRNGQKIYVRINRLLNALTGGYATPASNELGAQIRRLCPLQGLKSWKKIPETTKAAVVQALLDKFQIGDEFYNDPQAKKIVDHKAYLMYKDWRYNLKQDFLGLQKEGVDDPSNHPPAGIAFEDWKHLIDEAWQDESHKKRSEAGKRNRAKLPYNHTSGSRSFTIAMDALAQSSGQELPDFCEFYEISHTSKKTKDWIHPRCAELHSEMVTIRDEATQSGTPLTPEELSRQVLGERKRYLWGFGIGPEPSSSISADTRAHDREMETLRSEIETLREDQMREREAQQTQIDQLKTMVTNLTQLLQVELLILVLDVSSTVMLPMRRKDFRNSRFPQCLCHPCNPNSHL